MPPAKPIVPGQFRRHARKLAQRFAPALTGKELQELAYGDSNKTLWNLIRHKRPDLAFRYLYAMRPAGSGHNYSDTLIFLKQILIPALESTAYQNQDLEHLIDAYQNHFHCKIAVDLLSHIHTREMSEETREKLIALEPIIGERMTQDAFDKYMQLELKTLTSAILLDLWPMDPFPKSADGIDRYETCKQNTLDSFTAVIQQIKDPKWLEAPARNLLMLPWNDFTDTLISQLASLLKEPKLKQSYLGASPLFLRFSQFATCNFVPDFYTQYIDPSEVSDDNYNFTLNLVLDDLEDCLQKITLNQLTTSHERENGKPSLHDVQAPVDHGRIISFKNQLAYLIPKTNNIELLDRIETIVDDSFHGPWFTQTGQPNPEDPDVNFLKEQIRQRLSELNSSF